MFQLLKRVSITLVGLLALTAFARAQVDTPQRRIERAIAELKTEHPNAKIELNEKTGLPKVIKNLSTPQLGLNPRPEAKLEDVDKIVNDFFSQNNALFLQAGPTTSIRITNKTLDPQIKGRALARVQQIVGGVDIFGAEAAIGVNLGSSEVDRLSTTFVVPPEIDLKPSTVDSEAREFVEKDYAVLLKEHPDTAETELAAVGPRPKTSTSLVVFDPMVFGLPGNGPKLAWLIKIGTFTYFVDAKDKTHIIYRYRELPSDLARLTYDANGSGSLPGKLVLNESGPLDGQTPSQDARQAHEFAGSTYRYYHDVFNRDSYDAGGSPLVSTVRYLNMRNALWINHQMEYGPGFAGSPDVVGHEITHGVIQATANLQYFGESGAANESIADFFGLMVSASIKPCDWKIGKEIPGFSAAHPLRDFATPHNGGFKADQVFSDTNQGQPNYYTERVTAASLICSSTTDRDNGCVHFNSGILNEAFYLGAKGGSGPKGDVAVTALGPNKLQQIIYRTLTTKLTSGSTFRDVANESVDSCTELAEQTLFNISQADCIHLPDAYRAVGIPIN